MAPTPSSDNTITALLKIERFRRIVNWLCEHREELENLDKVQIEIVFNCAGKTVSVSKRETYHNI